MVELSRALARCKDSEDSPSEQAGAEARQDAGVAMLRLHALHHISRQLFERHRRVQVEKLSSTCTETCM